jgi:hypothetical protein
MDWGTIELQVIRLASDLRPDDVRIVFVVGALLIAAAIVVHLLTLGRGRRCDHGVSEAKDDSSAVAPRQAAADSGPDPVDRISPSPRPYKGADPTLAHRLRLPFPLKSPTDNRYSRYQGDLGEAVVFQILASEGWFLLPSKYNSINGIDGICVRKSDEGKKDEFEFLIVEVKTVRASNSDDEVQNGNTGNVACEDLSNEKIFERLDKLPAEYNPYWDEELLTALKGGLKAGWPFVRRQRWGVFLGDGIVTVTDIDDQGRATMWRRRNREADRAMIQGLLEFARDYHAMVIEKVEKSGATSDLDVIAEADLDRLPEEAPDCVA